MKEDPRTPEEIARQERINLYLEQLAKESAEMWGPPKADPVYPVELLELFGLQAESDFNN